MHAIYDLEIAKLIAVPGKAFALGYSYCKGWDDHVGMGISVIGLQVGDTAPRPIFNATEFDDQLEYLDVTCLIGFNSKAFDDKVMAANGSTMAVTHYDLLEEVRIAAGFSAEYRSVPRGYSYALGAIAEANGMAKTGSGELAPKLWQDGEFSTVITYCLSDVRITAELLHLGLKGALIDPNTGNRLRLRDLP